MVCTASLPIRPSVERAHRSFAPCQSSASPSSQWAQHTSPDGRPFWSRNGVSVWEKPTELKTPAEREMDKTPWKEYETGGRKYWVHSQSKETTWNMPKEISARMNPDQQHSTAPRSHLDRHPRPLQVSRPPFLSPAPEEPLTFFQIYSAPPASASPAHPSLPRAPSFVAHTPLPAGPAAASPLGGSRSPMTPHTGALVAPGQFPPSLPARPAGLPPAPIAPLAASAAATVSFATQAEAESAFKGMLKTLGVDSTWTWEMVMKEAITEPLYKALRTLAERKSAFERYLDETRKEEKEERDRSLQRCRKEWGKAMEKIGGGLGMEEGVKSWWSWERGKRVMSEKAPDVWKLPRNDDERRILFDEFIANLRANEETRKRELRGKNMDKLTKILESLQLDLAGPVRWQDITSGTTWKSIYPLLASDTRYLNLLGTPGSSPLDLFWDIVDELDVRAEEDEQVVELVAKEKGVVVGEETVEDEFIKALEGDARVDKMDYKVIKAAFDKLLGRAVRMAKEERRRAEKKLRLLVDDLRYAYKKLDPPVDLDSTYEDDTPEFQALEDNEDARRTAFDKFIKRQKEKRAEREAAEADRTERDRLRQERYEREKERDREYEAERARDRERRRAARGSSELPYGEERKRRTSAAGEGGERYEDDVRERKVARVETDRPARDAAREPSEASEVKIKEDGEEGELEDGEV
ncbi:SPOSA6832_01840 [Sporobolomyces salmonicolor]|uniref:SPOSA6832_01840-mRNA-1:cds n=1 Tax=Sporidiobolus salmonicolor TaxID=5005 RepID=A0A0D6EK22_SPOSA|nr:SPOSA6832_01840 [Sporobolomyces salmonicolor]